jgi:DNA-binding HxlR family transcriptional regulator
MQNRGGWWRVAAAIVHDSVKRAPTSPLADALARVGDRWTLLVVAALLNAPKRFNELQEELDGIAPNVLSSRLKSLQEHALIIAEPYQDRPPQP